MRSTSSRTIGIALVLCLLNFVAAANPDLHRSQQLEVDFYAFPYGTSMTTNMSWSATGYSRGVGSLQLLGPGSFVEMRFWVSESTRPILVINHRSSWAPGCPENGRAPVTIEVNGHRVAMGISPAACANTDSYSEDSWDIGSLLSSGENRVRITAANLCSTYCLRSVRVELFKALSRLVEEFQMVTSVEDSRPASSDRRVFLADGRRVVLWVKLKESARDLPITWRFVDPSGNVLHEADREASHRVWAWMKILGHTPVLLPGRYRAQLFVENFLVLDVPFQIVPSF